MPETTLGVRIATRDAARFVGRARELAALEELLGDEASAQVAIVSGPGGGGKSALLRELTRRAAARGRQTFAFDARDLVPSADVLGAALAPALDAERPLIALDSWERMEAVGGLLRSELLPRLPQDAVVAIATRGRPDPEWFRGGWEHIVLDLALGPLDDSEADALLLARGVDDGAERARLIEWAGGSPLALALAANGGVARSELLPGGEPPPSLEEPLRRILDLRPSGSLPDALALASLAHVTTPDLLAAVLPGADAERSFAWLASQPSAEPWRDGVMLHDLVARAVRAELRRHFPDRERELRRRLVDALYIRAAGSGFVEFARDLQHLVQNPMIRWGFASDVSGRYRVDAPRPGDLEAAAARGGPRRRRWLESAARYFQESPERVCVVRDVHDALCGYGISMSPLNAPAFADEDPVVGPRLADARRRFPSGAAVIQRQAIELTDGHSAPVIALLGMAAMLGAGVSNPLGAYLPIRPGDAVALAFSEAVGGHPLPELAAELGGVRVECHLVDCGPGGLVAHQRAAVYRDLGLPAPAAERPPTLAQVREALRDYASAGGPGADVARAALRARIDGAVEDAFGSSHRERRLREVLVRAYIEPAATQEQAANELHLSRTTYFRELRHAVRRVAAHVGAADVPPATGLAPDRH